MRRLSLTLFLVATFTLRAFAQVSVGGSITGTTADQQGVPLPGATVTVQGVDATRTFTTGADGRYRFLTLAPGLYKVTAALPGFSTVVRENVIVIVGGNVDLPMELKVAPVAETVTVLGESPIVDTRASGTATNFTASELNAIPTSRDPWALLRTVPGVMVDRVNIAGNETGQQSNFQAKGTRPADAVWTMDGVVITDMAAIGASPTYFNYSNFDEIQVSTAGQDIRQPTGGVGLNFIVKRGTNQFKGAGRGFFTGEGLEASNVPDELAARTPPVTPDTADHNKQIGDYSFEIGGPIARDKAWFFGSWAYQDIRLVRSAGNLIDKTVLKTTNIKGNWQATKDDMVSVLWFLGAKEKTGRSPGDAGILFDAATATWEQGGSYVDGRPQGLLKVEDNHVFGSHLYLSGRYAYYNTGFGLVPSGGLDMNAGRSLVTQSSYGSTRRSLNIRPQISTSIDANSFNNWGGATHDLRFGFGWRQVKATTGTLYPGNMILALENSVTNTRARVYREGLGTDQARYVDFYIGDSIALGRTTFDVGVRYDQQWGASLPSETQSNQAFSSLVPGIQYAGADGPFTWQNVSPRVGVTYALDAARKTILRASYNQYAGQLSTAYLQFGNPSASAGYVEYPWQDLNGNHLAEANEVDTSTVLSFAGGFNPAAPTSVTSANRIDPDLKAPKTRSAVVGIDRELRPNLGLQVNYSFTHTNDFAGDTTFTPWRAAGGGYLVASDYLPGPVLTGTIPTVGGAYSIQTYIPDAAKVTAGGNGQFETNYPGYTSRYHGIEASLVKRMSNHWMGRIGTAWNNPTENYDVTVDGLGNPTPRDTEPLVNGGAFVVRSSGSGAGDIFIHGHWQLNINGGYEFPHQILVAGNLFGRQGYPIPVYQDASLGRDGSLRVLVSSELDTYRLPNLWNLDLRVSHEFRFGKSRGNVGVDLFNVANSNTGLVRGRNVTATGQTGFYALAQNLSPRILRFAVELGF
jgi:hypothetical protein